MACVPARHNICSKLMKIPSIWLKNLVLVNPQILFKILMVNFVNKYPRMKKCSFSLHFLKNNFKTICHGNASEFK